MPKTAGTENNLTASQSNLTAQPVPFDWGTLANAGIGALGNIYGGFASADAMKYQADIASKLAVDQALLGTKLSKQQLEESGREFDVSTEQAKQQREALNKAYSDILTKGQNDLASAEGALFNESNIVNPAVDMLTNNITTQNLRDISDTGNQISSNLAGMGVRGGQTADTLGAISNLGLQGQSDINDIIANEASQREAQKRAYLSSKGLNAQNALYQSPRS